jgi:hypothetical protein
MAAKRPEHDVICGYAYRIGNGWRLTDAEHNPILDPHLSAQVMKHIAQAENFRTAQANSRLGNVEYDPNRQFHKGTIGPDGLHVWPVQWDGEDWSPNHPTMGYPGKDFVIEDGYVHHTPYDLTVSPEEVTPEQYEEALFRTQPLTESERLAIHRATGARFRKGASSGGPSIDWVYHATPVANRESIAQNGLQMSRAQNQSRDPGIYFYTDPAKAQAHAEQSSQSYGQPWEVWRFQRPSVTQQNALGFHYTPENVPASAMERVASSGGPSTMPCPVCGKDGCTQCGTPWWLNQSPEERKSSVRLHYGGSMR